MQMGANHAIRSRTTATMRCFTATTSGFVGLFAAQYGTPHWFHADESPARYCRLN